MIKKEYQGWTYLSTYMKDRADMIMQGYEVADSMIQEKDVWMLCAWITYVKGYIIYKKK